MIRNKKSASASLPSSWGLTKIAASHFWTNRRPFIGILGVFMVLYLLLAHELNGLTLIGGSTDVSTPVTDSTALYYVIIMTLTSLAIIWILRRTWSGEAPSVKDAFYSGMGPIVPYILTMLLMLFMILPLALGNLVYGSVIENNIAQTLLEQFLWAFVYCLAGLLSLYLVSSAIFAPYIVTMPGLSPLRAIRSSKTIVRLSRMAIIRKLLFLVLFIVLVGSSVLLPFVILAPYLVEVLYWSITCLALIYGHIYIYAIYRELLGGEVADHK